MGSISPLSADDSASTASAVVPPNMLDRSAPSPISSLVLLADCSADMPKFCSWLPTSVANSLYSFWLRPTLLAAFLLHASICLLESPNTVSTPPTLCCRSPAAFAQLAAPAPMAASAALAATLALPTLSLKDMLARWALSIAATALVASPIMRMARIALFIVSPPLPLARPLRLSRVPFPTVPNRCPSPPG